MTQNKTDNWVRVFKVDEPKRHKNGFTVYKVTSVELNQASSTAHVCNGINIPELHEYIEQVFPKGAPEAVTNIVVWKRYSDFKKLRKSLKVHHKNCNIAEDLPQLTKVRYFKRFEEDLIEERVKCALGLLNFIGRHPPLFTCVPFLQFFNNSYQVSDTISDYEISETNDNGNVTDSSSELCNFSFVEKTHLNGENKKESTFQDEGNLTGDADSEYVCSSDDEIISLSEGVETLPGILFDAKPKDTLSLDGVSLKRKNYDESDIKNSNREGDMAKSLTSLTDHFERETVMCYAEKPVKDSEMWVCIRPQDVRSKSHFLLPSGLSGEESNAPPKAEDYLVEAGYHIAQAQKCEIGGEYESAFSFYKSGMASLLTGMSEDNCKERKLAVQEKIKLYAQRAENVYSLHVSKKKESEKDNATPCSEGLKAYKVLSIIDKVLLVLNTEDNKQYVIKVLEKSPCPVDLKRKTVIPYNVPYMVKLVKYFENENSIFLVLQHASGGKLWDFVERCFDSYRASINMENEPDFVEHKPVEVAEETVGEKKEKSYFDVLRDYTTYTAKKMFGYYDSEEDGVEPTETDPVLTSKELNPEIPECVNEDSDVTDLVKNSQRLLESIKNTLEESDYVTYSLTKDLDDIETALVLERKFDRDALDCQKNPASVTRSRQEKEIGENKCRTASSSLDRSGQSSRLRDMVGKGSVLSEATIKEWAAQMFVALETLHRWGVTCRDLHPGNVLLDQNGDLLLTFQCHWQGVDVCMSEEAVTGLYAAPETTKIFPVTPVADWWSYGALLYQLLTGKSLSSCYPGGIFSHTSITFPEFLSPEACSLLTELLRYDPSERLGGGVNGSDDIKCHPFFSSIDWQLVYDN